VIAIEASATAVPTPLKVAVCGLLLALSLNRSVPVLDPIALGENETDATQLAPPTSVAGLNGQLEVTGKSVALVTMLLIVNDEDWLLVRVTAWAGPVLPIVWLAKVTLAGLINAGTTPTPARLTVGLKLASSAIVRVPLRNPSSVGVK
jgi:hypothetical protein